MHKIDEICSKIAEVYYNGTDVLPKYMALVEQLRTYVELGEFSYKMSSREWTKEDRLKYDELIQQIKEQENEK